VELRRRRSQIFESDLESAEQSAAALVNITHTAMALALLAVTTEEVAAAVTAPTGHWWLFFSQMPLAIYFVVSLRDIPLDLAIQRLCTCYGLPLGLLVAFSYSPLYGVLTCAALWYLFTHSVPFAPIRLPSGQFRQLIWRAVRHSPVAGVRDAAREEPETNLFAVSVYVKMVLPLVNLINKIGDAVSPPRPKRTLMGSEVSWLFMAINAVDRFLHLVTRHHVLIPLAWRAMQKRAKSVRATPEINSENDETLHAVALFLGDLDKSVVGVSATGRLLINNLVVGMLDLRSSVQRYLMNHPEVLHVRTASRAPDVYTERDQRVANGQSSVISPGPRADSDPQADCHPGHAAHRLDVPAGAAGAGPARAALALLGDEPSDSARREEQVLHRPAHRPGAGRH